jgi:phosphate transport system protein
MAHRVDEQVADAVNALLQGDEEMAETVIARDDAVDSLELRIDRLCERILALHAPVAMDLRTILMAVKINADFERIGDHCRNLARHASYINASPHLVSATEFPKMSDMARCMLREVEAAFLEQDRLKAREVIALDLQVNRLHADTRGQLLHVCRTTTADEAEAAAHLLTASKSLERISDHAKNIAHSVVFMIEGTDIRHSSLQDKDAASSDASSSETA